MAYVIKKHALLTIVDEDGDVEREFSPLIDLLMSESTFLEHRECMDCGRPCCAASVFVFQFGDSHELLVWGQDIFKDAAADIFLEEEAPLDPPDYEGNPSAPGGGKPQ